MATSGVDYYRRLLDPQRSMEKWTAVCLLLIFFGLMLILLPMTARLIDDPNRPAPIIRILPFSILAVAWGIATILGRRRHQRWVRRELEFLSALEREKQ
jgi:hypothetical protein